MCAQHGLRMDNTGVLAMNVKLHIMIGCAQSFGVGQSFLCSNKSERNGVNLVGKQWILVGVRCF